MQTGVEVSFSCVPISGRENTRWNIVRDVCADGGSDGKGPLHRSS